MTITPFPEALNMDGLRTTLHLDRYPDGRPCYIAAHPDLADCVAYGEKPEDAIRNLEAARALIGEFDDNSHRTPTVAQSVSVGNNWMQLQVA